MVGCQCAFGGRSGMGEAIAAPPCSPRASQKPFAQVLTHFAWQQQPPPLTREGKIAKYVPAGCENAEPVAPHSSRRQFGNNAAGSDHRPQLPSPPPLHCKGKPHWGALGEEKPAPGQLLPQPPASGWCCPVLTPLPGCKNIPKMKPAAAQGPSRGAQGSDSSRGGSQCW